MNKNLKKTLSVILTVLMIVTMMPFTLPAKAAGIPVGETLYLKPGSHWSKDEARFAAYLFNNTDYSSYCWVDLEPVAENDGYYQFTVPEGTWDGFLFCRMVPGTTNGWGNCWNNTGDLFYDGVNNLYSIVENIDATYGVGAWSKWSPGEVNSVTLYLVNVGGWETPCCYYWGSFAGVTFPGTEMTLYGNDGQYDIYTIDIPVDGLKGFLFVNKDGAGQTPDISHKTLTTGTIFDTDGKVLTDYCVGHEWENGICNICKKVCAHTETDETAKCTVCGKTVYAITKQPSESDLSVEVNFAEGTTYQWMKKGERQEKEITDKNAMGIGGSPTNTDVAAEYESGMGWMSAFSNGEYSPVVRLYCKKGDVIRVPAEGSVTKAYVSDSLIVGRDPLDMLEYETAQADGSIYFEIENDGEYLIVVDIVRGETFRAYITTEADFEKIDGATESAYYAKEIGEYCCVVRFEDGTEVISDTVSVTSVHVCDFSGAWEYDDWEHWKNCTDINCDEESERESHIFTDGDCCDYCGMKCPHLYVNIDTDECDFCYSSIPTYVIESGDEITVDDVIILDFTPTVSGGYTISSDSDDGQDPMIELYCDGAYLASADDIDVEYGKYDFALYYEFEAGKTYRFVVHDYGCYYGFTVKLEKATHTCDFSGEWKSDDEKHWKECSCGETADEANHTPADGEEATCLGILCEECGNWYGTPDTSNHIGGIVEVEAKAPTCSEIGWYDYEYCQDCDYTTYVEIPADYSAHTPDESIGKSCNGYYCTTCKSWYGEKEDHKWAEDLICSVCQAEACFSVITGETVTYCASFADAYEKAEEGSTVQLLRECTDPTPDFLDKAFTFDFAGNSWMYAGASSRENVMIRANVTFIDSVGGGYLDCGVHLQTEEATFDGGSYWYIALDGVNNVSLMDYLAPCRAYYNKDGEEKDLTNESWTDLRISIGIGNHNWSDNNGICANGCGATCSHEWDEGVLTRPTKTEEGYYTYTCTVCNSTKAEPVERADYTAFNKALAQLKGYLDNEDMIDSAKDELETIINTYDTDDYIHSFIKGEEAGLAVLTTDIENLISTVESDIESGRVIKADYTEIDEAIAEIEQKLADENVTDEAKAGLEEIKSQLEEMKQNPVSSEADLAELETALEDYEAELDAGIEDGSAVKVDGLGELGACIAPIEQAIKEKYGEKPYQEILNSMSDENEAERRAILSEAMSLTGSLKDNEDKLAELKGRMEALLAKIENCLNGTHNVLKFEVTEEAKCGENAVESATCTLCGETVTREVENSALKHSFTKYEVTEEAKCGVEGKEVAYCDHGCGETDEKAIEALKHSFTKYEVTEEAKCGVEGKEVAYCDNGCGETDEKAIAALRHSFTKYEETEAPKCGVEGKEVAYCDHGCCETDEKTIEALTHSFIDYIYNDDATCEANGTMTAVCANGCGETDTVEAEDTMLDHADEDGDGICDDCETEIKDVCPDCGGPVHEEASISEYICLIMTIIKLLVSLINTISAAF